jgi:hypothetical protein
VFIVCLSCHFGMGKLPYHRERGILVEILYDTIILLSRVRSRTPGATPPRLFGKCVGKTSSSLPQSKHKNTQRFTLVQAARGDLA